MLVFFHDRIWALQQTNDRKIMRYTSIQELQTKQDTMQEIIFCIKCCVMLVCILVTGFTCAIGKMPIAIFPAVVVLGSCVIYIEYVIKKLRYQETK